MYFRPYTLAQYRKIKPQGYVEFSKLQPDLNSEELVAKRANAQRIKDFARNLQSFNKDQIVKQKESLEVNPRQERKEPTARDKAREFAKNIPKPKVRSAPKERSVECVSDGMNLEPERNLLEELETKHLQSKRQVEAIKKSLGL